jgi:hypothetical protein
MNDNQLKTSRPEIGKALEEHVSIFFFFFFFF